MLKFYQLIFREKNQFFTKNQSFSHKSQYNY
jgi:hypothetical protein